MKFNYLLDTIYYSAVKFEETQAAMLPELVPQAQLLAQYSYIQRQYTNYLTIFY